MENHNISKKNVAKSFIWAAIDKVSVQIISFFISVILARLLNPEDFGIIGMITIFLLLSEVIINSGFSQALIQKQKRTEEDFSTVFVFNVLIGLIAYFILFISAKLISDFYNTPILIDIIKMMALCFVLNSMVVVHRAKLTIKLDFKTLTIIGLISVVISGFFGIYFAYNGHGVWSLVYRSVINSVINVVLLMLVVKWKPRLLFSINSFKSLFRFSSKLLVLGVYGTILQNIYMVFIGKYFVKQDLGYYTRARQYTDITSNLFAKVLESVTFPMLSILQSNPSESFRMYRKIMNMTFFLILPSMTLLAVLSKPLIVIMLTEKWLPVVPLLQWLSFAKIFTPINAINVSLLNSKGRSDLYLKSDLVMIPIVIIIILITTSLNINAMVVGIFIQSIIGYFVVAYYPSKLFNYNIYRQLRNVSPYIFASIVMAFTVFFSISFFKSYYFQLFFGIFLGLLIYYFTCYLFKVDEVDEVNSMLKKIKIKLLSYLSK